MTSGNFLSQLIEKYQEVNPKILKSVLTDIENKEISKVIIKNYLKKNQVKKIIRL